ncbi:MAG: isoamylase, partial [Marmoricola sp.]|nr:isoamylase [Marmoricola sp.]
YNEKHNDANGEDNNDGESHNRSWNHGAEGPTEDEGVRALRARDQRNVLATLLLSQGVPMILHGDEMGRTQDGNNNTYAQDSEISWMDWATADQPLTDFTAALVRLRLKHPTFRRKQFFTGEAVTDGERLDDIVWLHPDGRVMEDDDWNAGGRSLGMYLNGHGIAGRDSRGNAIVDDDFLLFFNVGESVELTLPSQEYADGWDVVVDTGGVADSGRSYAAGDRVTLEERSVLVLREHSEPEREPDHSVAASLAVTGGGASNIDTSPGAPLSGPGPRR